MNTPSTYEPRHLRVDRMKVTLPAGLTPGYWKMTAVRATAAAPPLTGDNPNEWIVIGQRRALVEFAGRVARYHYAVDSTKIAAGVR